MNINPDKGPVDTSDTFWLLHFVKKVWKYPHDIRISVQTALIQIRVWVLYSDHLRIFEIFVNGRNIGPRQLHLFPYAGMVRMGITRICIYKQTMFSSRRGFLIHAVFHYRNTIKSNEHTAMIQKRSAPNS